jgi:hypothetical protein
MNTTRRRFWIAVLAMFGLACLMYAPSMGRTDDRNTAAQKKSPDQGHNSPQAQPKSPAKGSPAKQDPPNPPRTGSVRQTNQQTTTPPRTTNAQPLPNINNGYLGSGPSSSTGMFTGNVNGSGFGGGLNSSFFMGNSGLFNNFGFNNGIGFTNGFQGFAFSNTFGFNGGFNGSGLGSFPYNSPGFRTLLFNLTHDCTFQGLDVGNAGFNFTNVYTFNPGSGFAGAGFGGFYPGLGFNALGGGFGGGLGGFNGLGFFNANAGLNPALGVNAVGFNAFNPGFGVGGGVLGGFGFNGF